MIPFWKMHGAGNDFVVVEGKSHDWSALAPVLCNRRSGVGADGVLVALPTDGADVRMRMFNPDGTEDECGNGLRCLALYAVRRGLVARAEFAIRSLSGVKAARVESEDLPEASVTIDMGRARLEPAAVPVLVPGPDALDLSIDVDGETLHASALSTGTAHTVIFEMPDEARFQRLSPRLEHHPLFPERTSVLWTVVEAPDRARVRIWERAAGETLACGTGACAVAAAAHLTGRTGPRVAVTSRGGTLVVQVGLDLTLRMTGPAAIVYEGAFVTG
jgi:diaminopimelate epimerase